MSKELDWSERWQWYQQIGFTSYTKEVWEGKVPQREKNLPMTDGNYTVHYDCMYGTADLWNGDVLRAEVYPQKGTIVYINGTENPVIKFKYQRPEWVYPQIYFHNYESPFNAGTPMPMHRVVSILEIQLPDGHFPIWNLVREKIKQTLFYSEEGWQKAVYWYKTIESDAPLEEILAREGDYRGDQANRVQSGRCKKSRRKSEV